MPVSEHVYFDSHPNHGNRDQDRIGSVAAQSVVNFRGVEPVEQIKQCIGGHIGYLFLESIVVEQLERLTRLFDMSAVRYGVVSCIRFRWNLRVVQKWFLFP